VGTSHIYRYPGQVSGLDRERRLKHRPHVVWLTGLSAAGKSTIAHALEAQLFEMGVQAYVLDGDNVRHGLCGDLGFSEADRHENLRRIGEVCKLFLEAGTVVLAAFISPFRADREKVRGLVPHGEFMEVFVDCPLEVCERRDPKGIYRKARLGEIAQFTGISAPYEAPLNPELTLRTDRDDVATSVKTVLDCLMPRITG
jgi:adenylyl-sulfate kinase